MCHEKDLLLAIALLFKGLSGVEAQTVTDYDDNIYNTITIGTQVWMAENIRTTHYSDGRAINLVTGNSWLPSDYYYTKAYCWYNDDSTTYAKTYGALYTWGAAMDGAWTSNSIPSGVQGVCPLGWHVPSYGEWEIMIDYLGGWQVAGGKLKETGTIHWQLPNEGATNESGFTALPGGIRNYQGFYEIRQKGYWWSSTHNSECTVPKCVDKDAWSNYVCSDNNKIFSMFYPKTGGFSVRCLKGDKSMPIADFTSSSTTIDIGQVIQFSDISVNNPTKWLWDFGDGDTSSLQNPSHVYTVDGVYTVKLITSNNFGSDDETKIDYIIVAPKYIEPGIVFNPDLIYDSVKDIEGNIYKTIQIGNQTWMAENLKTIHYANGGYISGTWSYNNSDSLNDLYGRLYDQASVSHGATFNDNIPLQGVCPDGWHIPSIPEWQVMIDYLGGDGIAGGKLKEVGITHWQHPNVGATNESGFTALPGGYRDFSNYEFYNIGIIGYWWSYTSEYFNPLASICIYRGNNDFNLLCLHEFMSFSVRCLKDNNTFLANNFNINTTLLYPNPANERLYLKNYNYVNTTIMIFDLQSRQVLVKKIDSESIDISDLSQGNYIVKLIYPEKIIITKFIKE